MSTVDPAAQVPEVRGPLEGVRVVELGVVIAGSAAAAILADWGAEVVKLEPPEGDPQRGNVEPAYFRLDNRGKRSVAVDLRTDEGHEVVLALLERADVFLTNLRPSALARLRLDAALLTARFPSLVYAGITGYGEGDPDRPDTTWGRSGRAPEQRSPSPRRAASRRSSDRAWGTIRRR